MDAMYELVLCEEDVVTKMNSLWSASHTAGGGLLSARLNGLEMLSFQDDPRPLLGFETINFETAKSSQVQT